MREKKQEFFFHLQKKKRGKTQKVFFFIFVFRAHAYARGTTANTTYSQIKRR